MANQLYNKAREGFLAALIDWDHGDIRVVLVDAAQYTFAVTHQFLSSIPTAARIATSGQLTGRTVVDGVADAADIVFPSVTGVTVEAVVIYQNTGTDSTSRLIAYIDTATGLPFTPHGGNVTVKWSDLANRIFKI